MNEDHAQNLLYRSVTSGWTCHPNIKARKVIRAGEKTYILVHHRSHAEYCGRFSGSQTCNSWWGLWDTSNTQRNGMMDNQMSAHHEGRFSKSIAEQFLSKVNLPTDFAKDLTSKDFNVINI